MYTTTSPYTRTRRRICLVAGLAAAACAAGEVAAVATFGLPPTRKHPAHRGDGTALASAAPAATVHHPGGQVLAVLLLALVTLAAGAALALAARRAVLTRRPVAAPQPQRAEQRPWPPRDESDDEEVHPW